MIDEMILAKLRILTAEERAILAGQDTITDADMHLLEERFGVKCREGWLS